MWAPTVARKMKQLRIAGPDSCREVACFPKSALGRSSTSGKAPSCPSHDLAERRFANQPLFLGIVCFQWFVRSRRCTFGPIRVHPGSSMQRECNGCSCEVQDGMPPKAASARHQHSRPVRRCVVDVDRRIRLPRQERVLRRCPNLPPHVRQGESLPIPRML